MKNQDPVLIKIQEKQAKIEEESRLRPKHQIKNRIVIATSILLLSGILIGLLRIILILVK